MVHARREWPLMIAIAAAQEADHARGLAVIAAPEADELEFLADRLGEPERGLDRLRAAREQLDMGDPLRQQRAHQIEKMGARLGGETAEGHPLELLLEP